MAQTATTENEYLELPDDQDVVIGGSATGGDYVDPSRGMAEFKIVDIKFRKGRPFPGDPPDKEVPNQFEIRFESCKEPGATIRYWVNHKPNGFYSENHKMTALVAALYPDGVPDGFRIPRSLWGMHCQLLISQARDSANKPRVKKDGTPVVTIKALEPLDEGHPLRGEPDPDIADSTVSGVRDQPADVRTPQAVEAQELPF